MARGIWEYSEQSWSGGELAVTTTESGALFEVTQEKGVDSYNQEFTCCCAVPRDKLPELIELLHAAANSPDRSGEAIETTKIGSTEGESRK